MVDARARSVFDCAQDCGRGPVHRQLADSLRAAWPIRIRILLEEDSYRRNVGCCRTDVICHLVVHHATTSPDSIFVESVANPLPNPSFALPRTAHRMDNTTNLL